MYEYYLEHNYNGSNHAIYGYTYENACRRNKIDPKVWTVIYADYID